MLEVNWFGDVDLSQHAMRKGFLDSGFRNLLKERDLERFLKEPAKSSYRSPTGRLGWRASHWPY
jgi:hypothetical protein